MMRFLRRCIYFLLTVVVLAMIGLLLFAVLFDANQFKDDIAQNFEESTGRRLVITGDMHLQFLPLRLVINQAEIGNPPDFSNDQPFAKIALTSADIALWPLLHRVVRIQEVRFQDARLNFVQLADGRNNWGEWKKQKNASKKINKSEAEKDDHKNFQVALEAIDIQNSHLFYKDLQKNRTAKFDLARAQLSGIDEKKVDFILKGVIHPPGITQGIATQWSGQVLFQDGRYALQDAQVEASVAEGLLLLSSKVNLQYQQGHFSYRLDPLTLTCADLKAKGSVLGSEKSVATDLQAATFSPKECVFLFTEKSQFLPEKMAFSLHAKSDLQALQLTVPTLQLDDSNGQVDLQADWPKKEFSFQARLDRLDLERYTYPKPTIAENSPSSRNLPSPGLETEMPESKGGRQKQAWQGEGVIDIQRASYKKLILKNIKLQPQYRQQKLHMPFSFAAANGQVDGSFAAAMTNPPAYALALDLKNIAIAPVISAFNEHQILDGVLDGNLELTAQGQDSKALLSSNRGKMSFTISNGAVYGFDLEAAIQKAKTALTGEKVSNQQTDEKKTPFQRLEGQGNIVAASIDPGNFTLQSPMLDAKGDGRVDFLARILDYHVTAYPRGSLAADLQKVAKELKDVAIPLRIYGNLDKPTVQVDIAALLAAQQKTAIERGLDKALEKAPKPVQDFLKKNMEKWF